MMDEQLRSMAMLGRRRTSGWRFWTRCLRWAVRSGIPPVGFHHFTIFWWGEGGLVVADGRRTQRVTGIMKS